MRTAQVFSFVRRHAQRDWSAQDVAEFYRVEAALMKAGLRVSSARGLTDEGDPWFVFSRGEDDEVIIHFARIDGRYVISAPGYCGNASGYDFRVLVRDTLERHPVLRTKPSGDNLFLHPAALLVMLVATAFLKAGAAAEAATSRGATDAATETKSRSGVPAPVTVTLDAAQETLLLSAVSAAVMAPLLMNTSTTTVLALAPAAPDTLDAQHTAPDGPMLFDKPGDALAAGWKGLGSATSPQPVIVTPLEPATNVTAHAASLGDMPALRPGTLDPVHIGFPSDGLAFPLVVPPADVASNPVVNAQLVPLSGLSDIPQADKVLLLALGVTDTVAYAPVAPAALSNLIHADVHIATVTAHAGSAPPVETVAAVTPAAAPATTISTSSPITTEASSAAGSTSVPGLAAPITPPPAAIPNISAVLAIVQLFQAVEIQPAVLLNDHGAIFYDAYAIDTQYSAVKSVTYDFGDGFSISLVGLPAELTHAGAHV
jgi:hypothetical protein